ncbi:MAG: DUF2505 domain-containing protein [Pseudomonadota bacterium]|nr:DUF2505 domain-containing protein [Pseudomonadota bacterium]
MKQESDIQYYPGVSAEKLFSVFQEPKFYETRCELLNIDNYKLKQCEPQNNQFVVKLQSDVDIPSDKLPKIARSFLGEQLESLITTRWKLSEDEPYTANYEIEINKLPVEINGKMVLNNTDEGCQNLVSVEVESSIPFVGGKVEDMMAKYFIKALEKDRKAILVYLSQVEAVNG